MGVLIKYKFVLVNISMCLLILSIIVLLTMVISRNNILVLEKEGINKLEYIREKTIELVSLEEVFRDKDEIENNELVILLEDLADDFLASDSSHKYFAGNPDMVVIGSAVHTNWITFKNAYIDFNITGDISAFIKSGESYYSNLNSTINSVEKYINVYEKKNKMLSICTLISICLTGFFALASIKSIILDKKKKEEVKIEENNVNIEEKLSYGVINLEELDLEEVDLSVDRDVSILVFYINDLEEAEETIKTNTISLFAEQIEVAKEVLNGKVIIKKYSEFEFIVYTKNTNEKNVGEYLNKVIYLVEKINKDSDNDNDKDQFNMNFICGCSITTETTETITTKELIGVAIDDMIYNIKCQKKMVE